MGGGVFVADSGRVGVCSGSGASESVYVVGVERVEEHL